MSPAQTLIIYVIRTLRIPFPPSRPSTAMLAVPVSCAIIGAVLPFTLLSRLLGFTSLPLAFFLVLIGMILSYLMLAELAKDRFYRSQKLPPGRRSGHAQKRRRIRRRAARFTRPVVSGPARLLAGDPAPPAGDPRARRDRSPLTGVWDESPGCAAGGRTCRHSGTSAPDVPGTAGRTLGVIPAVRGGPRRDRTT